MTTLDKLIKEKGPILSGELIKSLTNNEKTLSNEAARKRLSRIGGDIFRVRGFFADGQILFYDKDIFGTEEYFSGLLNALKIAGKQYFLIIQSLDFHYGFLKKTQIPAYSINPIGKLKGHLTFETALQNLIKLRLINIDGEYIYNLSEVPFSSNNLKRSKGVEMAKNFLLAQFNDWTRNIGLVSFNSSTFHSEFGKYQFNFVAPSYIGSLTKKTANSTVPAFVIADILIGNVINENQVDFFIKKISALKQQKNLAKFIPFLILDSIDTKALNTLKSNGVVVGFTNELFGNNYKELLNSLINLVTNAGAILKKNPEAYLDLVSKLNKLVDGKTNNLRGDLFELAVGYYQGRICNSIDIGKMIIQDGNRREIDVFGLQPNSVIICECKGYNHMVTENEIEIWLGEKVPVIRKWILENATLSDRKISFQYWSTGGYTPEALDLLEKKKNGTKKYTIDYFDLNKMLEMSKEVNSKKFTEILREYYIKEL